MKDAAAQCIWHHRPLIVSIIRYGKIDVYRVYFDVTPIYA